MALNETKVMKVDNYFISVLPNASHHHFRYVIDDYGKVKSLKPVRTDELPLIVIKRMLVDFPWSKEKIMRSLQFTEVGRDILIELGLSKAMSSEQQV